MTVSRGPDGGTLPVRGPVLVVGSGLLGTSVGLALRRAGVEVWLADRDPAVVAAAAARGAGVAYDGGGAPALVVVAVPPAAAGTALLEQLRRHPDATVTDVTSVKARPLAAIAGAPDHARRTVGGHPMAGREVSGPDGARVDLLDDRVWVLTPLPDTDPDRLQQVRDLVVTCGAVPVQMSPESHDRAVALTSHAPQVLSSLLAARLADADPRYVQVSGQGLRDVTRIAASDPLLWTEILGANSAPVADVLDAVAADLDGVRAALRALSAEDGDGSARETVTDALQRGNDGRARVPGKHGGGAADYAVVPVMLADEPGQLALLFTAAGEAGFNLEDVRIDHVLGRPSGLVELSVRPESGPPLVAALRGLGFDVRA